MSAANLDSWRKALHVDGSLRDIYVQGTTEREWTALFSFFERSGYPRRYTRDGRDSPVPSRPDALGDSSCAHLLAVDIGEGVAVHCHFYVASEIELDVDPREIKSTDAIACLQRLFVGVGEALARDVILTEENSPESVLIRYSSRDGRLKYERTD